MSLGMLLDIHHSACTAHSLRVGRSPNDARQGLIVRAVFRLCSGLKIEFKKAGQAPGVYYIIQRVRDTAGHHNLLTLLLPTSRDSREDIRHAIKTINCLPVDYSGHLPILLNDHSPHVISKNIILILILATIPEEALAADIALHFWYSLCMPSDYKEAVSRPIIKYLLGSYFGEDDPACDAVRFGASSLFYVHDVQPLHRFHRHAGASTDNPE